MSAGEQVAIVLTALRDGAGAVESMARCVVARVHDRAGVPVW